MHGHNHLLAALPASERKRLFPHLETVPLTLGQVLYEFGDRLDHAYFPIDATVALLYDVRDSAPAEISVVGNDGLVGLALVVGGRTTLNRAIVQGAGHAYRLPGEVLHSEFTGDDELQHLLLRYTQALLVQMAQTAECNSHHPVHQRLCRWLLLTLDRSTGNRLSISQDLIATILGAARDEVAGACARLQRLGAIAAGSGQLVVLNRPQLERLCCACYAAVKGEAERLMPTSQYKLRPVI